jgi:putative addiction module component (TIGR02574 family)
MAHGQVDVESLTPEERLDLLDRLWESLSRESSDVPVTDAQKRELDRRLDDFDQDAGGGQPLGVPWDEVLRQIKSRP